jgi:hypothetical protein
MTEGATIFELNFKANLNYALKLNRTKQTKMKRTKLTIYKSQHGHYI